MSRVEEVVQAINETTSLSALDLGPDPYYEGMRSLRITGESGADRFRGKLPVSMELIEQPDLDLAVSEVEENVAQALRCARANRLFTAEELDAR